MSDRSRFIMNLSLCGIQQRNHGVRNDRNVLDVSFTASITMVTDEDFYSIIFSSNCQLVKWKTVPTNY